MWGVKGSGTQLIYDQLYAAALTGPLIHSLSLITRSDYPSPLAFPVIISLPLAQLAKVKLSEA